MKIFSPRVLILLDKIIFSQKFVFKQKLAAVWHLSIFLTSVNLDSSSPRFLILSS